MGKLVTALTKSPIDPLTNYYQLCGFLFREAFQCLVEDGVGRRRGLPEFDVRLVDRNGRLEPLFVQRCSGGREVARGRQPEACAVGQPKELLRRGATDRVLANQIGA